MQYIVHYDCGVILSGLRGYSTMSAQICACGTLGEIANVLRAVKADISSLWQSTRSMHRRIGHDKPLLYRFIEGQRILEGSIAHTPSSPSCEPGFAASFNQTSDTALFRPSPAQHQTGFGHLHFTRAWRRM